MKLKFGAIVTEGSGKIGGHVAAKNKSGAYLRTKSVPVNRQTSAQLERRSSLASISQAWRELTDFQRTAWNATAPDFAKSDIFGDIRQISGFNIYQRLNAIRRLCGQSLLTVPPVLSAVDFETLDAVTITLDPVYLNIWFNGTVSTSLMVIFEATPPGPASVVVSKSDYRIFSVSVGDYQDYTLTDEYLAKFGSIGSLGQAIHFRWSFVALASGLRSSYFYSRKIITE